MIQKIILLFKNNRRKTVSFFLSIVLFSLTFITTNYLLAYIDKAPKESAVENSLQDQPIDPDTVEKTDKGLDILLLGYGGAGHPGGTLSDTMLLVSVDKSNKNVYLISIPRDTWVTLPISSDLTENYKINMAHAIGVDDTRYGYKQPEFKGEHGGGKMAMHAAQVVTGFEPDHYIGIDFSGFENAIDVLGGITVDVPVTFDDYFYPVKGLENEPCGKSPEEIARLTEELSGFQLEKQFECRYEHLHFDDGPSKMSGEEALKFVRSRHSEQHGGDFARSQRQQALLLGIRDKLLSYESIDDFVPFLEQLLQIVSTDLDKQTVLELAKVYKNYKEYNVININLTEENVFTSSRSSSGQFILVPKAGVNNFDEVQNYINEQITQAVGE